ncbi:MAG TPA: hypothetical protein VHZ81_14145 [Galbitalea sp.]|jgi:hypothetical protein|nr:hypothetical protein [Galbitalea sp.]
MNRRILGTIVMIVVAAAVTLGGAGVAYAYWTAGGSGTAAGGTGTTVAVTLTPATPTAALLPGGTSGVVLTAINSNVATVRINSFSLDTTQGNAGFAVDAAHSACTLGALSFTTQTNGGSGWTVPGRVGATNGSLSITLTNSVSMSAAALNACQGATFTFYVVAG